MKDKCVEEIKSTIRGFKQTIGKLKKKIEREKFFPAEVNICPSDDVKYTKKEKGLELLPTLQEKTPALVFLVQAKNVQYIIFSTVGFTKGLRDEAKQNPSLILVEKL